MGFSKKRFFITLGLSALIWFVSLFVQSLFTLTDITNSFSLLGSSCEVTGYPIALCLSENKFAEAIGIYIINIVFWFWVIHFISGIFFKKSD
jgi:hypothetical protein